MMLKWWMQKKEYDVTRRKRWTSRVGGWMVAAEMLKWKRARRGGRDVRRGVSKSEWWTVCSIPIPSSCTYCRSGAAGALPIWQSPESFGLNPYWLILPKLLFPLFFPLQIWETSRNRGVEKESGHCVMSVLPAVLPRMGVPPEWAMNARD